MLYAQRTLLISGDKSFEESFHPYHPKNDGRYTWSYWSWSGWSAEYARGSNFTHLKHCVNPERTAKVCHLDVVLSERVVKHQSNRAFLCGWVMKKEVYNRSYLSRLGITSEADLFEVPGCMLRLAIWPTEKLPEPLDESVQSQLSTKRSKAFFQIGLQFRCGDNSFSKVAKGNSDFNPEYVFDTTAKWNGTRFMDDK